MSVNQQLRELHFHDSQITSIQLNFPGGATRSCTIEMIYYNWEGNQKKESGSSRSEKKWIYRRLIMRFGFVGYFEFSAPDLINRAQDINEAFIDYNIESLRDHFLKCKAEFPKAKYPIFESGETVSIKFELQNFGDTEAGYVWIAGNDVSLEWQDELGGEKGHLDISEN